MPFAPDVAISVADPAPKARSALVATVTQAEGESAVASMSVQFPPAFGFNERFRPQRCQPAQEDERACPPESRVGSISAVSGIADVPATGGVFIADDFRLLIFADALGGLIEIKAVGEISAKPDNSFGVVFSGLPDLPLRSIELSLEGGDLALLKNPARCGTYTLPSTFKSHQAETVEALPTVAIEGCKPALRVRRVRFAAPGRLSWKVTPATKATRVVVTRGGDVVARKRVTQPSVELDLEPGRYRARLTPLAGKRRGPATRTSFRVD